ncbi:hypothetical protein JZ751_008132 [Albula glossodonta]|uniref:Troponin I, fast skeletal muscle n=1 Tax=Albula glossodonta TaxID=121402 RepID=A0A8T2N2M7_9TELE|nr:hypothetical protein JZ751_008132 [Albula glossodonta]
MSWGCVLGFLYVVCLYYQNVPSLLSSLFHSISTQSSSIPRCPKSPQSCPMPITSHGRDPHHLPLNKALPIPHPAFLLLCSFFFSWSMMLSIAKGLLEVEEREREEERVRYMAENCPPLSLPGNSQDLQELCKKLQHKIDGIDEERYDLEMKVNKCAKEIEDMKFKVIDLKGKFKKPALRRVRMSADAMLKALLGSKHKVNMDLRANLKQVKKEVKEEQLCRELHQKIDVVDEERYILESKVNLVVKEGKFKKPPLKKVRMSADAMLQALLGSKHKVTLDLRANLKQVKKEVKEEDKELRDVGDWRKNIEDKAGMGGRKKMFESEA